MIDRRRRLPNVLAFVGMLCLAAACTTPQPRPLYTSLQAAGTYGHFEQQLADDQFLVGYEAPVETRYRGSRAERQREVDRKIALAYDMALLRAAEIAQARGHETFRISQRENDVRIEERDEYYYDPPYLFPHPYWSHRYFAMPYYAYPRSMDRVTEIAVAVRFVAHLGAQSGDEDVFDARDVIERISAKYSIPRYPNT